MLSLKIREIRIAKKISQVDRAKMLGVTKQSVSNWENDNIQPSIEMLTRIADALSVYADYLLGRDEKRYIDVQVGVLYSAARLFRALYSTHNFVPRKLAPFGLW